MKENKNGVVVLDFHDHAVLVLLHGSPVLGIFLVLLGVLAGGPAVGVVSKGKWVKLLTSDTENNKFTSHVDGFSGHGDDVVVTEDLEADLVDNLWPTRWSG